MNRGYVKQRPWTADAGRSKRRSGEYGKPGGLGVVQPPETSSELTVAERQINILRDKLRHIDRQLAAATQNNGKLVSMLETAKAEILRLKGALEQEGQPPYSFGTVVQINPRKQPSAGSSGRQPPKSPWISSTPAARCAWESARSSTSTSSL